MELNTLEREREMKWVRGQRSNRRRNEERGRLTGGFKERGKGICLRGDGGGRVKDERREDVDR